MNEIQTHDPQEILDGTDARVFMVVWSSSKGTFFGTGGGGFQNAEHGGQMNSPAVMRDRAVEEYYNLVRAAKNSPHVTDGRIDLVPLPSFSS